MSNRGVALITGASRGIGRGIALELARHGRHHLALNYAGNHEAAAEAKALCSDATDAEVDVFQADVSSSEDRRRLVAEVLERFGRIDSLVNNAGVAPKERLDVLEASEESFDRLISINLKGPYFLTQAAAGAMREQEALAGVPRAIVNVTSISSFAPSVNRGDYCVSKAGLSMMTQLFAARLAEFGIQVMEVQPGVIATDMTAGVQEKYDQLFADGLAPMRRWGSPEDVGKAVAAIALGQFPYSTGDTIRVDGGFHIRRL